MSNSYLIQISRDGKNQWVCQSFSTSGSSISSVAQHLNFFLQQKNFLVSDEGKVKWTANKHWFQGIRVDDQNTTGLRKAYYLRKLGHQILIEQTIELVSEIGIEAFNELKNTFTPAVTHIKSSLATNYWNCKPQKVIISPSMAEHLTSEHNDYFQVEIAFYAIVNQLLRSEGEINFLKIAQEAMNGKKTSRLQDIFEEEIRFAYEAEDLNRLSRESQVILRTYAQLFTEDELRENINRILIGGGSHERVSKLLWFLKP